ncbi:hypothetical protein WMZ97_09910 [Lentibacillus sp. N15]|uniref:TolB family protein n=1 Tax=Lentibacillus songyuanensis TaxID=3136161 RepID=UPI0031BA6303
MSLKMKNLTLITSMVMLFLLLWGASYFAEPAKGTSGFAENPDVSPDDEELVFSYYDDGDAALYTASLDDGMATLLADPEEGESYIRPSFSPDGEKVAFIKQWEEEEKPYGELMIVDRTTDGKVVELTNGDNLVTEAVFSSDGKDIYFTMAGVYKNYSPIASERPHDFDIYRMNVQTKEIEQITHRKAYDISGLAAVPNGEQIMYQSNDSIVFYSPDDGIRSTLVPTGESAPKEPILSSPALSSDGKRVVFSGVANKDAHGTFVYEGFQMDVDTGRAEQVTSFHEHVADAMYFNHRNALLVTIDKKFAQSNDPEYSYWLVDLDNEKRKRLGITLPDDQE